MERQREMPNEGKRAENGVIQPQAKKYPGLPIASRESRSEAWKNKEDCPQSLQKKQPANTLKFSLQSQENIFVLF